MQTLERILLGIAGIAIMVVLCLQINLINQHVTEPEPARIIILQTGKTETYYSGIVYYVDYMVDLVPYTQSFCSQELLELFIQRLGEIGEVSEL